jgi:hypothetical protein
LLREDARVIVGTNNKLLGGPRQIRKMQYGRELAQGSVKPEDKIEMDVLCASRDSRSSMYKVYIVVNHVKRKDWDVTSHLYNLLIVLDYSSLYNLYDSLFMLDYFFSLEPITHSHA